MYENKPKKAFLIRAWLNFWQLLRWLRSTTLDLIFLLIIAVIIAAIVSPKHASLPEEAPLHIAPQGFLVDQYSFNPSSLDFTSNLPQETHVRELVETIKYAADDQRITTLILQLDYLLGGGLSKLEEIGAALEIFKASGKPIIAYADSYTQQQYYLASYADEIYLHEMGSLLLTGFGVYRNYMKDAVDKLAINFHVFQAGDYKDAVENYTRNNMSKPSRDHYSQVINDLWGVYSSRIENQRNLPSGTLDDYINNLPIHLEKADKDQAELALDFGLVDSVTSRVNLRQQLVQRFGEGRRKATFQAIEYKDYLQYIDAAKPGPQNQAAIGLIVGRGTILDGKQPEGDIGGDSMAELIRQARHDSDIQVLVLRINSGGGSAFASEVIRRELLATRAAGIPVLISMGSMAASGGYWLATAADEIWATPTTITGSIGVWALVPTFENTLNKLGITNDGVGTTKMSAAMHLERPMTKETERVIQLGIDSVYQRFLNIVADARDSTVEEIHKIAQGRIWTGATAHSLGLVDKLGSLDDVLNAAAERATMDKPYVKMIQRTLSPKEELMRALMSEAKVMQEQVMQNSLPEWAQILKALLEPTTANLETSTLHRPPSTRIYAQCLPCFTP